MIRIDYEEFTIDVPIERRMTVEQFLSVADRLERIAGRVQAAPVYAPATPVYSQTQAYAAPVQEHAQHQWHHEHSLAFDEHEGQQALGVHHPDPALHSHMPERTEEFRFEHEDAQRIEYFMEKLAKQLTKMEETHLRLERMEHTMADHGLGPRH